MSSTNKLGVSIGRFISWPLWRVLIWVFYHRRANNPAADIERGNALRPLADNIQIHKPEVRQACILSETEAFRTGLRGLAWDARLLTRPWDFHLKEIRVPIHIWHGTADNQATVSMARYIASKIPNCKATILENEAHLLLFSHWEEILTQLILE
jgi:pimeloyl-ACP methyl ester carboxylesterase